MGRAIIVGNKALCGRLLTQLNAAGPVLRRGRTLLTACSTGRRMLVAVHDFVPAQTRPCPGRSTAPRKRSRGIRPPSADDRDTCGVRGSVCDRRGDHVMIACGRGAVSLTGVDFEIDGSAGCASLLSSVKLGLP